MQLPTRTNVFFACTLSPCNEAHNISLNDFQRKKYACQISHELYTSQLLIEKTLQKNSEISSSVDSGHFFFKISITM